MLKESIEKFMSADAMQNSSVNLHSFKYEKFDGSGGTVDYNLSDWTLTEIVQNEFSMGAITVWMQTDKSYKLIAKQSKKAAIKCRDADRRDYFNNVDHELVKARIASIPVTIY